MPHKWRVFAFIITMLIGIGISACAKSSTNGTQRTGQITVIDTNSFKDAKAYWYFYGLIRNDTNHTVSDVQVKIKLLDSAGVELYNYTAHTTLPSLAPGETSPFSDFTAAPYPNGRTMQAIIIASQSEADLSRANLEYRNITTWVGENNIVYLAGEAYNRGTKPARINAIAGSMVNPSGKFITASAAFPFLSYVEAKGSSPFVMAFDAPLGEAASLTKYDLYSDAVSTPAIPQKDITLSTNPMKYQDADGHMHLVGTVSNNTNKAMNIYLVAEVRDASGKSVDVNAVYIPVPLNPGAAFPYDFSSWAAADFVPDAYATITDARVYVDWIATSESATQSYSLTTKDDKNAFDGIVGRFTGTVVNTSGTVLSAAFVNVSLYDKASGTIIATNLTDVPNALKKDASGTYQLYISPPNDIDPTKVKIVITAVGQ